MTREDLKRLLGGVVRALPHGPALALSTWDLSRDLSGGLMQSGVSLASLLERHGSPLNVLDEARLERNASRFLRVPPGAKAGCEVYYSYKTNPLPQVLKKLHAHGVKAEVGSPYELWLALELGVGPEDIVFDGPAKTPQAITLALERNIGLINLNGRAELRLVAELARALHKRPRVGLRVVVPGGRAGQFGERIDTGAAMESFREAQGLPELEVVALHSHVNGELASLEALEAFVRPLLAFTDRLREELGLTLEVLDFGGNLPCPTVSRFSPSARKLAVTLGRQPAPRPPGSVLSIDGYVTSLVTMVERHMAARGCSRPRIFVEPGRAMTGDTMLQLCRVLSVRKQDETGCTWAILDAGINVAEPVPNELHQLLVVKARTPDTRLYRLCGPSCTLGDQLYPATRLPELEVGDALAIMDTGAYFVPLETCFSFPRAGVVGLKDGQVEVLRRPETFEDLIVRDGLHPTASRPPRPTPAGRAPLPSGMSGDRQAHLEGRPW